MLKQIVTSGRLRAALAANAIAFPRFSSIVRVEQFSYIKSCLKVRIMAASVPDWKDPSYPHPKYIVVSGGVISGVGKGIISSSTGVSVQHIVRTQPRKIRAPIKERNILPWSSDVHSFSVRSTSMMPGAA